MCCLLIKTRRCEQILLFFWKKFLTFIFQKTDFSPVKSNQRIFCVTKMDVASPLQSQGFLFLSVIFSFRIMLTDNMKLFFPFPSFRIGGKYSHNLFCWDFKYFASQSLNFVFLFFYIMNKKTTYLKNILFCENDKK